MTNRRSFRFTMTQEEKLKRQRNEQECIVFIPKYKSIYNLLLPSVDHENRGTEGIKE